jgi:hypothetical protein
MYSPLGKILPPRRDPVAARRLCSRQIRNDPESAYVPDPGKKHLIRV